MSLVEHDEELLVGVVLEPVLRLIEDLALDRPHQHVLEHRVVGHEKVGRRRLHLVARRELGVVGQRDGTNEVALRVLPATGLALAFAVVPALDVGLARPLSPALEALDQCLRFSPLVLVLAARVLEVVDIEAGEGLELLAVLVLHAHAGVRGSARVAGKPGRTPRPLLE